MASFATRCYSVRDQLAVGIRDSNLSERMQMDTDLTLEKAKKLAQQKEAVREQHSELWDQKGSKRDPIVLKQLQRRPQSKRGSGLHPRKA